MALGKYSKVDGRKSSSNYCSTVTLVVFVTLCLVGVWMMASSSVVPFQIVETISGNKNYISTIENDGKMINDTSTETTKGSDSKQFEDNPSEGHKLEEPNGYHWKLCNVTAGSDFIPCLDNLEAIQNLRTTKHYEHRERHCTYMLIFS